LAELMRETRVNTLIDTSVVVEEEAPCRSLTEEQVSQLYHIAHEAVSNAQKHARATSITAEVYEQDGAFRMRVSDNGQGFDPTNNNRHTGRGLMNMAERVRAIGGHLWVESAPGQGTTLTVELPLNGEGML
ncbi:MAG: ATP-binding protein, partial [Gemmatimonadales bacterium]|nr:ATP-binding protein [Gemmatimonadales bacterium]